MLYGAQSTLDSVPLGEIDDYITANGSKCYLRGRKLIVRFSTDWRTGHTDKESWSSGIFQAYKDYGLNHACFHSWTPPKAAFEAADELGLYVLKYFWRGRWMGKALDIEEVEPFLRPN